MTNKPTDRIFFEALEEILESSVFMVVCVRRTEKGISIVCFFSFFIFCKSVTRFYEMHAFDVSPSFSQGTLSYTPFERTL